MSASDCHNSETQSASRARSLVICQLRTDIVSKRLDVLYHRSPLDT